MDCKCRALSDRRTADRAFMVASLKDKRFVTGGRPIQHSWTASVTDTAEPRRSNEASGTTTGSTDAAGAASRAMDGE